MYFVEGGWNNKVACWSHSFHIIFHLNETAPEWPAFFTNDDVIFSQPSPPLYSKDKYVSTHALQSHRDSAHTWKFNFEYAVKSSLEHSTSYGPQYWVVTDRQISLCEYYEVLQRALDFAASCGHDKCSGFIEGGEFLGRLTASWASFSWSRDK
jgi:hypothetical protein